MSEYQMSQIAFMETTNIPEIYTGQIQQKILKMEKSIYHRMDLRN